MSEAAQLSPRQLGNCPGLAIGDDGLVWVDSLSKKHLLSKAKRRSIGEVATRLGCSERTVRRRLDAGEIYPTIRTTVQGVEIFDVGVDDYIHRAALRTSKEAARA